MQFNPKMGYSGNEQDYQLIKTSISELKKSNNQKEVLRYLTNVLPNPTDVVILDNAQDTVKSVKAQLANKNLLPLADSGIYYKGTVAGGKPLIYNNATVISSFNNIDVSEYKGIYAVIKLIEGETYTLTINNLVNNCATKQIKLAVGFRSSEDTIFGTSEKENAKVSTDYNLSSLTFTVPSGYPYCLVGFYNYPTVAGDTVSFNAMQLEYGTTATAYTPYISDFSTVKVIGCGKNLLPYPYVNTTKTENGITFTDNGDGSITISGQAEGEAYFYLCNIDFGSENMWNEAANNNGYYVSGCEHFFYNKNNKASVIIVPSGTDYSTNPITVKPQIELGTTATAYEPYKGQTYTPTATGEATGIEVLTPTTNIINDKGLLFTKVIGDDFNYIN